MAGAVVGALTLAATGCSGSSDATETTVAPTIASTAPPATEPPDTTAAPTIASTTAAPTTAAPTTTVDDEAATLAAVEQAYFDAHAAYLAAARDPSNPELRAAIEGLFVGANLDLAISQLDGFLDSNYAARADEANPSRTEILAGPALVPGRSDLTELVVCEIDTERYFEIGAAPDGGDALVTDEIVVTRLLVRYELVGTSWKSSSGEVLAKLNTAEECSP